MIVTCECNSCLLKDLCVNRNTKLTKIDGPDHLYVQLSCNHLYPGKIIQSFNCDRCKNKPICKIFNKKSDQEGNATIDTYKTNMEIWVEYRTNKGAFTPVLHCKGYME